MGIFNATPKAERDRIYGEEERAARVRRRREAVGQRGYSPTDGRVDDLGGYGVTLDQAEGTVSVGDPELEEPVTLPLAGLRARLETLAEARDRVTGTRLAMLGVAAFAVPKRDRRRVLVLETPSGAQAVAVVDGTDEAHLRQWVAWLNRRGAAAESAE